MCNMIVVISCTPYMYHVYGISYTNMTVGMHTSLSQPQMHILQQSMHHLAVVLLFSKYRRSHSYVGFHGLGTQHEENALTPGFTLPACADADFAWSFEFLLASNLAFSSA